eukprot:2173069-Prymnesium_polylepis.1
MARPTAPTHGDASAMRAQLPGGGPLPVSVASTHVLVPRARSRRVARGREASTAPLRFRSHEHLCSSLFGTAISHGSPNRAFATRADVARVATEAGQSYAAVATQLVRRPEEHVFPAFVGVDAAPAAPWTHGVVYLATGGAWSKDGWRTREWERECGTGSVGAGAGAGVGAGVGHVAGVAGGQPNE